jgi:protein-S-isoprenylcysteine O-methyltransferase Ste14
MTLDFLGWIQWVWTLVGLYWLIGALRSKPVARREKWSSQVFHLAIMTLACGLLFSDSMRIGFLGHRLLPETDVIGGIGLGLTIAGCAFAVWARARLGSNWSASVTRKQGHELVRGGPYAIVRHPIYSGLLLGILGTALAQGELRGLLAVGLASVGWLLKARIEERFLADEFGGDYVTYRRRVKQLIPYVF